MDNDLEELMDEAIKICMQHEKVSPYLFQRKLRVNLSAGMWIFEELEHRGVISKTEPDYENENIIGIVDKQKINPKLPN